MTKANVLASLQKCAKKLDRTPTYTEIWRMSKITKYMIKLHFGTMAEALKRAGVAARGVGHRLDTLTLLEDWAHLTRKVGRPPSFMEYRRAGNYGANSFLNRCGAWSRVGERFCALVKERKKENVWADVLRIVKEWEGKTTAEGRRKMARRVPSERVMHDEVQPRRKIHADRPIYGATGQAAGTAQCADNRKRGDIRFWAGGRQAGLRGGTHPNSVSRLRGATRGSSGKVAAGED
jgi:hypothetical protein